MRRLILSALLAAFFWCARLSGATGDITLTVRPDGWTASLSVEGFTTGATYAFGLTGNNVPTSTTPYLTVVSEGYDTAGTLGTVTRRVYLVPRGTTGIIRFPFGTVYLTGVYTTGAFVDGETITQAVSGATGIIVGNQAAGGRLYFKSVTGTFNNVNTCTGGTSGATFTSASTITTPTVPTNDEKDTGTALVALVGLSDYVYVDDNTGAGKSGTAPTFTAPANFIVNSGGAAQNSTASTNAAVTQNSTAVYPKVVANWSWPGNQRITGDFTLRCVAFHGTSVFTDATTQVGGGKMNITAVKFTTADTSAHTVTTTVTAPSVDSGLGDAIPVVEWIGTMAVSTLTALDILTCNFIAYPLVGDAGSILDTSVGTAQPTPLFGPITMLNDKSNTYGRTFAAVSSGGNDTTGIAVKREDYASDALADAAAVATPCLTIGGAYAKIVAKNLADRSRNDAGAGEIALTAGTFAFVGAGSAFGVKPNNWAIVRPAAGVARADAIVGGQAGGLDLKDMVKFSGATIGGTAGFMFQSIDTIWFDQCVMSATGTAVINSGVGSYYVTHSVLAGYVQGLVGNGTWITAPGIVRGNNLNSFTRSIQTYTVIGNSKATTDVAASNIFVRERAAGQTTPIANNAIVAYNKILGYQVAGSAGLMWGFLNASTHGGAVIQNLMENYDNGAAALGDLAGSGTITPINNIIVWNNTFVGQRILFAYNDTGSVSFERSFWSEKNNIYVNYGNKSDNFTTQNGNRIGNWSTVFGVGSTGNVWGSLTGFSSNFLKEFPGLFVINNTSLQANDYFKFTNDLSYIGGSDTAGGGTYTLQSTSPAKGVPRDWLLPYDLAGNPRTATSDAGAYTPTGLTKVGGSGTTKVGGSGTVKVQAR